jgi:hypothetical protein
MWYIVVHCGTVPHRKFSDLAHGVVSSGSNAEMGMTIISFVLCERLISRELSRTPMKISIFTSCESWNASEKHDPKKSKWFKTQMRASFVNKEHLGHIKTLKYLIWAGLYHECQWPMTFVPECNVQLYGRQEAIPVKSQIIPASYQDTAGAER